MTKISGKETKPEIIVRKYLFSKGYRYRKNVESLPGTPDIVLSKYRTVIFVNGCFWHGHNCKAGKLPETRKKFWSMKISDNKLRDKYVNNTLLKLGWNVIIVWQCELNNKLNRQIRLDQLVNQIIKNE